MKYKVIVLILTILSILSINIIHASNNDLTLLGKVIYLDPGHGGKDPGAIYKDIYESDINLSISKKIYDLLLSKGAIVYLTRDGNYDLSVTNAVNRKRSDLSRRANIINKSNCDLYISIHLNAELSKNLKTDRKYKETSEMYLHKRVERPGILIEVGFLSNASERYLLTKDDYQMKVANTVTNGIIRYLNS